MRGRLQALCKTPRASVNFVPDNVADLKEFYGW